MTYREKKEYLESYIIAQRRIIGLERELEEWHTIATSITQKITPVMVNTNEVGRKIENCAIKCASIEDMIFKEIENAEASRRQIKESILCIRDSRRREIMLLRYVNNCSVKQIASMYEKDIDNIYKTIRNTTKSMDIINN